MASFGKSSREKLEHLHPDLRAVLEHCIKFFDFTVLETHRTPERQAELYSIGKSKIKHGKHNEYPSHAVDIAPWDAEEKRIPWPDKNADRETYAKELGRFYALAYYVMGVAEAMGVKVRLGADWDGDDKFTDQTFDDVVHIELSGGIA